MQLPIKMRSWQKNLIAILFFMPHIHGMAQNYGNAKYVQKKREIFTCHRREKPL